jgi:hypothetical protein
MSDTTPRPRRRTTKAAADTPAADATTPAAEAVVEVTAIVPVDAEPDPEVSALSRWDALAADIAMASQRAEGLSFDYHDRWGNKEARSHVASLRRLKGRIERARKDAKAVHLERGRAVDATARTLEEAVQGLIEPHEQALNQIAAVEEARIAGHRAVLDRIAALGDLITVTTAAEAEQRLAELAEIDSTVLEEFATAGANRLAEAIDQMEAHIATLKQREAEQAELEALRAEKAARDEADRLERIRQEAIEQERARVEQERIAEQQRLERDQAERQQREERRRVEAADAAARREAEIQALAAAARRAQEEAERRAAEAEQQLAEAAAREQQRQALEDKWREQELQRQAELLEQERQCQIAAEQERENLQQQFRDQLVWTAGDMTTGELIDQLIAGTLHHAITIDWKVVAPSSSWANATPW